MSVADIDDCKDVTCADNAECVDGVADYACNCTTEGIGGKLCDKGEYREGDRERERERRERKIEQREREMDGNERKRERSDGARIQREKERQRQKESNRVELEEIGK